MVELLGYRIHGYLLGLDNHLTRIVHVLPGQIPHPGVQRSAEEQRMAFGLMPHSLENTPKIRQKAHIEQPIRLVDHQKSKILQLNLGLPAEIDETPGSSDEHIHPLFQHRLLAPVAHPAVHRSDGEIEVFSEHLPLAFNLSREFPGRYDDESLFSSVLLLGEQELKNTEKKRRRFARAGLGLGINIPMVSNEELEAFRLYRHRCLEPGLVYSPLDSFFEPEIRECHVQMSILTASPEAVLRRENTTPLLVLVTVLSEFFLPLMGGDFLSFSLASAGHC